VISARNLTKYYGDRRALSDVSFCIQDGEIVGFIGLNGAGKTTALKLLSGLLFPSEGSISLNNLSTTESPLVARAQVGFLSEQPTLYSDITVREMLIYAAKLYDLRSSKLGAAVDRSIELGQLEDVEHDLIAWLSHGYRQRVGLAMAVVHSPPILILDEPTNGLDPKQIVQMRQVIRDLAEEHTVLLSSHLLGEISQTCDRLLVLHEGKLIAEGTEESLIQSANTIKRKIVAVGNAALLRETLEQSEATILTLENLPNGLVEATIQVSSSNKIETTVVALVQAGLGIREIVPIGQELEHSFLKLTQSLEGKEQAS